MTTLSLLKAIDQNILRLWKPMTIFLFSTILFLSLYPSPRLPMMNEGVDKLYHFIAYLSLVLPLGYVQPKYTLLYLFILILISGTIEVIQPFINRYGEWLDFLANTLGIFAGFLVGRITAKFINNKIRMWRK